MHRGRAQHRGRQRRQSFGQARVAYAQHHELHFFQEVRGGFHHDIKAFLVVKTAYHAGQYQVLVLFKPQFLLTALGLPDDSHSKKVCVAILPRG